MCTLQVTINKTAFSSDRTELSVRAANKAVMACCSAILQVFSLLLVQSTSTLTQVDRTVEDGATGRDVVVATVNKIRNSGIFPDDFQFLRRMARVESGDGDSITAGDIWQVSRSGVAWRKLRQFFRHVDRIMQAQQLQMQVQTAFNITWTDTFPSVQDLNKPLYSALAVMLYIQAIRETIPNDIPGQADLWQAVFHSGRITTQLTRVDFVRITNDAAAFEAGEITLGDGVTGTKVVNATVNRIRDSGLFPDDYEFLRRMARVESNDGETVTIGGIWQVTRSIAWTTFQHLFRVNTRAQDLKMLVQTAFNLSWTSSLFLVRELNKPLYSALVVQLYIQVQGETVPDDISAQADLWHRLFNTGSTTFTRLDFIRTATALRDAAAFAAGDLTLGEGVAGENVVIATVEKIRESGIFPNDSQFLRRMAWVESNDGEKTTTGGIWYVTRSYAWSKLQHFFLNVDRVEDAQRLQTLVQSAFNITWTSVFPTVAELNRPLYSALAVRLYIQAKGETIPSDIPGQAALWEKLFIKSIRTSTITKYDFIRIVTAMENTYTGPFDRRTLEDGATGTEVIIAAVNAVTESRIFPYDYKFLRRMARVESNDGEVETTGGIWQVARSDAWRKLQHYFQRRRVERNARALYLQVQVQTAFHITWNSTFPTFQDLNKPLYSALAVMLYIQVQRKTIPDNILLQADLWHSLFSTGRTITKYDFIRIATAMENTYTGPFDRRTLEEGATGTDVIIATVNAVTESRVFPYDYKFLRRMARVESNDGVETIATGGIWQVPRSQVWRKLAIYFGHRHVEQNALYLQVQVQTAFHITWNSTFPTFQDLNKPLYSALAVMLYIQVRRKTIPDNILLQADLWHSLFNTGPTTLTRDDFIAAATSLDEEVCEIRSRGIDMIFVMDVSGSIGSYNYELLKQLAINITDEFEIGLNHTKVGWINYNSNAWVVFDLNAYTDKTSLHQAIRSIVYTGGGRSIGSGLLELYNNGFTSAAGARSSLNVPRIAIVVTGGQSPIGPIQNAAMLINQQKTTDVYVTGIGVHNYSQLLEIAKAGISTDPERNVFTLPGFEIRGLQQLQEVIRARSCFSSSFIEANPEGLQSVNIPDGTTAYVNVNCPPEGLTIKGCSKEGKIIFYISRPTSTPNSAMYDEIIEVEENTCVDTHVECTSEEETGRRRRQLVSPGKVNDGVEESNEFHLSQF